MDLVIARPAFASLALAALLLCAGAVPAQAAFAGASVAAPAGASVSLRFWTPARMKRAQPLSVQLAGGSQVERSAAASASPSARALHETPYRTPPRAPAAARRGVAASDPAARASSTFQTVAEPTLPGNSQNGAVFIVLGHGEGLARCSGTSVNAPNLSVVITAGHCVNSGGPGGEWYDHKWVFVPGYHNGERPFGVFAAKWIGSTRQWIGSADENYDVGAAVVSRNERGQRLAAAAGADGIAWGLAPGQLFDVHGYPVAAPFDGSTQQLCLQTPYEGHDIASFFWPGPLNLAVQCNVTGGASGGGWTIPGGQLNSITTYGYRSDPATDFGPYFGKAVGRLFGRAARVR